MMLLNFPPKRENLRTRYKILITESERQWKKAIKRSFSLVCHFFVIPTFFVCYLRFLLLYTHTLSLLYLPSGSYQYVREIDPHQKLSSFLLDGFLVLKKIAKRISCSKKSWEIYKKVSSCVFLEKIFYVCWFILQDNSLS